MYTRINRTTFFQSLHVVSTGRHMDVPRHHIVVNMKRHTEMEAHLQAWRTRVQRSLTQGRRRLCIYYRAWKRSGSPNEEGDSGRLQAPEAQGWEAGRAEEQ